MILKTADLPRRCRKSSMLARMGWVWSSKNGPKFVPNPAADVAKEVLDYLVDQHGYGNKDTRYGKALERRFGGIGYGWERDMLRLVLAVLFRAGSIEVSHGGEKFTSYQDPRCRTPFTNNTQFKSALFTPIKPIDLKTLTRAVECYETLTGKTVDVDKNAITDALKRFATEELKQVVPIEADAKANRLPILGPIQEYRESLSAIGSGSPDDCVETLVGSGTSLKESHDRLKKIAECLNETGLATIRQARTAVEQMWPQLETRGQSELGPKAEELKSLLSNEMFFESLPVIKAAGTEIQTAYYELYEKTHDTRTKQFDQAIEKIKGRAEWSDVPENMREPVLSPLVLRSCAVMDLLQGGLDCHFCKATISQMESDMLALGGLFAQALAQVQKSIDTCLKLQDAAGKARLAGFLHSGRMDDDEASNTPYNRLQDHLLKLLDEGIKIVVE